MLTIEIRKPRDGICSTCSGTGVVNPRRGELPLDIGAFCPDCDDGAARWSATIKLVGLIDPSIDLSEISGPDDLSTVRPNSRY